MVDHANANNHDLVFRADDLLDTWHYRASAIGGCTKALLASRLGYEQASNVKPGSVMHKKMIEGHEHEPHIVKYGIDTLHRLGLISSTRNYDPGRVSIEVFPNILVSGSVDGFPGKEYVVEAKAFAQSTWDTWKAYELDGPGFFLKYKWQISVYMLATNCPAIFVVYNKDTQEYDYRILENPLVPFEDIRDKVLQVESLVKGNILPDECDHPSWICPFSHLHSQGEGEAVPDKSKDKFDAAAAYFNKAKLDRDHANIEYEAAKANLSSVMIELGLEDSGVSESWTVDWIENKGRSSLNKSRVAKDLGISEKQLREMYYEPGKPFRYPKVSETI